MRFLKPFIRSFTIVVSLVVAGLAYAASPHELVVRSRVSLDQGTFEFDVKTVNQAGANIEIRCVDECDGHVPMYKENTGFSPMYAMLPKDGSPRFISLWTSGSAYRVMVHRIGEHKIDKLLEEGTRSPPVVSLDEQGNERIALCDEDKGCRIFQWTGNRYVVKPRH